MTWPDRLLSMADWIALPEDNTHRYEVAEGVMHVSPRPVSNHPWTVSELIIQVQRQLPAELRALPDVEVVVSPGSVRTDNVMKLDEYAEAGIEQCWIVDIDDPATVTVHRLVDGAYQRCDETSGTPRVETRIPLTVAVAGLTP